MALGTTGIRDAAGSLPPPIGVPGVLTEEVAASNPLHRRVAGQHKWDAGRCWMVNHHPVSPAARGRLGSADCMLELLVTVAPGDHYWVTCMCLRLSAWVLLLSGVRHIAVVLGVGFMGSTQCASQLLQLPLVALALLLGSTWPSPAVHSPYHTAGPHKLPGWHVQLDPGAPHSHPCTAGCRVGLWLCTAGAAYARAQPW
jgi:hypothetical protein